MRSTEADFGGQIHEAVRHRLGVGLRSKAKETRSEATPTDVWRARSPGTEG